MTKDLVKLKASNNGTVHNVSLYNNLPLNRGGFLDAKPLVKKGDIVQKGQLLADSNQSRGGEVALENCLCSFTHQQKPRSWDFAPVYWAFR